MGVLVIVGTDKRAFLLRSDTAEPAGAPDHNSANTRWLDSIDVPVNEGDTITILQAVSGG